MMQSLSNAIRQRKMLMVAIFLPLGMWAALWFGIIGESPNISELAHPRISQQFLRGLASVAPFLAAGVALAFILYRIEDRARIKVLFLGPLGLATVYALVGIVSTLKSPDGSIAIYWVASYLSVPIVLWSVTLIGDTTDQLRQIINFTWAVFTVAVVVVLAFGLLKLDLWNVLSHPDLWIRCPSQSWYQDSSHLIRQTGVGRYAAIAGILSMSALWQRNWRFFWAAVFLISMFMLITSGARTSVVGFGLAAPLVFLLHGGKRAAVAGLVGIALVIPIFWATGIHQTFLDTCIWRNALRVIQPAATSNQQPIIGDSAAPTEPLFNTEAPTEPLFNTETPKQYLGQVPEGYFAFSGRTEIWSNAMEFIKKSPMIGYGFHADRLLLAQHAHNSYVHAALQTGVIGGSAFIAALLFSFFHVFGILKNLSRFSNEHKTLLISSTGILVFLLVRSTFESTGAFFSVDWLLLAPLLLYVQVMNQSPIPNTESS